MTPDNDPRPHWRILRDAILKSIATSPRSFLTTADQVVERSQEFWETQLRSATWAVVQHRDEILGIAAAKSPGEADYYALQEEACFIESLWVDPGIRKHGVAERLVTYLIEQKRLVGIHKFYVWVFDHNDDAIRLYNRMDFRQTGNPSELPEVQFLREFGRAVTDEEELQRNADHRDADQRNLGITYRTLSG